MFGQSHVGGVARFGRQLLKGVAVARGVKGAGNRVQVCGLYAEAQGRVGTALERGVVLVVEVEGQYTCVACRRRTVEDQALLRGCDVLGFGVAGTERLVDAVFGRRLRLRGAEGSKPQENGEFVHIAKMANKSPETAIFSNVTACPPIRRLAYLVLFTTLCERNFYRF